jgi:hypothetical protein
MHADTIGGEAHPVGHGDTLIDGAGGPR